MFSRKQLLFIGFVMIFSCFQLDAARPVYFTNKTNEPKLNDSNLDLTLVTADGKTKFHLGTFKSSIDLDQYEISRKNEVKLIVKVINGIKLPLTTTNAPSNTSDILIPGVTYNILSSRDEISAGVIYLFINLEKK